MTHNILNRISFTAELLRRNRVRKNFPTEMSLLEGKSRAASSRPSVLFYTQHKVASIYTSEICRLMAADSDLVPVDYDAAVFLSELTAQEKDRIYNRSSPELYPPQGYCFAPIRSWHSGIADLSPFRVVLMLRDPRDVLVSLYFSMLVSHATPPVQNSAWETVARERQAAEVAGIDAYVMEKSAEILLRCEHYLANVYGRPNVLFVTYEELVTSFEPWLRKVVAHARFTPKPETLDRLIARSNFQVGAEDPSRHIRQVTPGDHRRKLSPKTIAALTEKFAAVLDKLGYEK